jgi:hypothetical protein
MGPDDRLIQGSVTEQAGLGRSPTGHNGCPRPLGLLVAGQRVP